MYSMGCKQILTGVAPFSGGFRSLKNNFNDFFNCRDDFIDKIVQNGTAG